MDTALRTPLTSMKLEADARVGIVGGGASGLAAAHALGARGYRRITVLERAPSVGGKCCTLVHRGRTYELGAALVTPAYRNVRALMREVGVQASPYLGGLWASVRDAVSRDAWGPLLRPARWMRTAADGARFAVELSRHRRIFRPGFDGVSDELARPFGDWCRAARCEAAEAATEPWVTAFGYGFLRDLPAAYVLKYTTLFAPPLFEILDDGYGGLFRKVAATLRDVDVRLSTHITSVVRRADGVTVRTTDGPLELDALILACPLDEALAFLDATASEEELFQRIRYQPYFVLGVSVSGPMPRCRYMFLRENFVPESIGQPMFAYRRWPATDTVFFYGFAPGSDWESAARRDVASTVERLGGRLDEVIAARRWRYFPHVEPDDFAAGFYRRLEALQGQRRTYYCGEILAFGAVETVVDYARTLVRRHFPAHTSTAGAARERD
jgi:glycine/D-amino acid oxidase-like deaminating enzyme